MGKDSNRSASEHARGGLLAGMGAYILWGVFPIYFHILRDVSPWVILCHRIVWSCMFLAVIVALRREWGSIMAVLRNQRTVFMLSIGAVLIATNWLVFIYAVGIGQTLQSSLGYFINPVLSVALGMIFLRERLRSLQWVALAVATLAIVNIAVRGTGLPWIALSLAFSFGFYGLVRKRVNVNSLHALLVESAILLPFAIVALVLLPDSMGGPRFALLSASGVLTATPLLLFGAAVRRLRLSTMGFLQYIGPSLQFLVAVLVFNEPLDKVRLLSFGLCWAAIGVYVLDSILTRQSQPPADEPE